MERSQSCRSESFFAILPRIVLVKDQEVVRLESRQSLSHSSHKRLERNSLVVAVNSWNEILRVDNIDFLRHRLMVYMGRSRLRLQNVKRYLGYDIYTCVRFKK